MSVDPERPFVGALCFDDLYGLAPDRVNMIAARGVVFLTEFRMDGHSYGGSIIAKSQEAAQDVADARGLGETIQGVLDSIYSEADIRRIFDRQAQPHTRRDDDLHRRFGL